MSDVFREYMDMRLRSRTLDFTLQQSGKQTRQGPVITISRETGCSGNSFVMELSAFLNNEPKTFGSIPWQWVNKEIIYETANELKVHPSRVQKLFKGEPRKLMDEVVESLSTRYYKNDRIVTKAISEIVKKIAARGNVIILGRGAVGLTQHMSHSLHIKLFAPRDWRIEKIQQKLKLSYIEAADFVDAGDKKRNELIRKFTRSDCANDIFDVLYNCKKLHNEDIFNSISGIIRKMKP